MADGVEFLPEERDGAEPVLVDEPHYRPDRRSVRTWALRGIVVALVAAGLTTWIATRPGGQHHGRTAPAAAAPTHITRHVPPGLGTVQCTFGAPVESDILAAMKQFLHPITIANLRAYRCVRGTAKAQRVVSETVLALRGGLIIQVDASTSGLDNLPALPAARPAGSSHILLGGTQAEAAGLTVRVTASGPAGRKAPLHKLTGLAEFLSLNLVL